MGIYYTGVLAGYLQLYRGTKYSEFPHWLDRWLKGRKQLGLLMLLNAILHVSTAPCGLLIVMPYFIFVLEHSDKIFHLKLRRKSWRTKSLAHNSSNIHMQALWTQEDHTKYHLFFFPFLLSINDTFSGLLHDGRYFQFTVEWFSLLHLWWVEKHVRSGYI